MKNFLIAALALVSTMIGSAHAQEAKQDFRLSNHTGYEIKEVYVSPSHSDDWEEDVLGRGTLPDQSAIDIHFHRSTTTCHWDLKVVYTDDGSSAVWHDIDLCSVEKITIHYNRSSDTTSATFD